jgi:hypothetical protein
MVIGVNNRAVMSMRIVNCAEIFRQKRCSSSGNQALTTGQ